MRHHHTGSGRRSVFPPDWQTAHAGLVTGSFTASITIRNPAGDTTGFNATTGQTDVTDAAAVYTGAAAVEMVTDPAVQLVADQPNTTSLYKVTLPVDVTGVKPDDVVHVVSSPDADLVGRDLLVTGPQLGDRRFSRVLHATLTG